MDGYSSKRVHVGIVSRKGPGVVLRDNMKDRDQSNQYSNRPGCTGRICSSSGAQVGCSSKFSSKRPFCSSSGKEGLGSSSGIQNLRKSFPDPFGKLPSKLEIDSSESDSIHDELEELELISPHGLFHTGLHAKSESPVLTNAMLMERGSCSTDFGNVSKRISIQSYEVDNEDPHASMRPRSLCQKSNGSSSSYSSRNLTSDSVSEVIPSNNSLLEPNLVRRKNVTKKMPFDGENSSSSRGKKASGTSRGQKCIYRHGISISDQIPGRNVFHRKNILSSHGTRSLTSVCSGGRHSYQGISDNLSLQDSLATTSWMPQINVSGSSNASTSLQLPSESHSRQHTTSTKSEGYSQRLHDIRQATSAEVDLSSTSTNASRFRGHNDDEIAEVLLALERIEQEEELTYEQAILLETSVFLNSLNIYDRHRDMRLDIDNMTYEQLLDLEEKMGTVSTALSEEALTKCLNRSIHQSKAEGGTAMDPIGDLSDVKCCICQEEYVSGDEVGRLRCEHKHHVACIQQWLRLKNWCPICKSSATASHPFR
uniref:RING-type E3 ubiquitin transferase n=1 Tax=Cucumis melo TaxID=3656 RepID=A0A9I9CHD7_CUCME